MEQIINLIVCVFLVMEQIINLIVCVFLPPY